ncbi:carbohydrate ABC transporter permease [Saccharothrix luteola]|uniref:carbohydrate ABC transporter permease n=1 Tax=Saccharothrix luteola TaxID=2893018 RepID=UPI001E49E6AA|nr:carbohydrate ABC transporter permease [Saccharothrix luteola]MCC8246237.1 carbohydrate ABC transporter permease [Saccharothrix luteola]
MTRDGFERAVIAVLRPVVIGCFLIATLLPFYSMLMLSLRPIEDLLRRPDSLLVDLGELTLATYADVLRPVAEGGQGFLSLLGTSAIVATASVALALAIAIPGAYAVSRLEFFGRRHVSSLFLVVYLFPSIVLAIPLFVLLTRMQLRGSLLGLVLVYIAQTVPVAIYMLKNYFETIPAGVEEAGLVDGLSRVGVIRRISLPLAVPSVIATGIFVFMIAWNEFLFALLFLVERRESWTVSLGLAQLSGSIEVPTTVLMAGSVVITAPVVLLFFLTERLLSQGLTSGAEKG